MAIRLPPEIIEVETITVGCDGGGGALGHPLVYLTMGENGQVSCGYCDRLFVLRSRPRQVAAEIGPGTPLADPGRTQPGHH